jgi:hypothetical protein
METVHFSMDLMTFLAICTMIIGVGGFTLAIYRFRNSSQLAWDDKVPSKTFSIIDAKIREFYQRVCTFQREQLEAQIKGQEKMRTIELQALKDVLHGELTQINSILDSKIDQVDKTLCEGLMRIEKRLEEKANRKDKLRRGEKDVNS